MGEIKITENNNQDGAFEENNLLDVSKNPSEVLTKKLDSIDNKQKIIILPHPRPDPDADACSLYMKKECDKRGLASEIYYHLSPIFYQNLAMRNILKLNSNGIMKKLGPLKSSELEKIFSDENYFILVDTTSFKGPSEAKDLKPDLIIDHHQGDAENKIYVDAGANISFLIDHYRKQGGDLQGDENLELRIASYYGIKVDTVDFDHSLMKDIDNEAKDYLESIMTDEDKDIMAKIDNPDLITKSKKAKYHRIAADLLDNENVFAVPNIIYNDPGIIPYVTDTFFKTENTDYVFLLGLCITEEDNSVFYELTGSARSRNPAINIDEIFKNTFYKLTDEDDAKRYFGGGKSLAGGISIGAGRMPLRTTYMDQSEEDREDIWSKDQTKYIKRIKDQLPE